MLASRLVLENVYVGSADVDAACDRGWLLGHFKPAGDVRHSDGVEIKWGVHPQRDDARNGSPVRNVRRCSC